MLVRTKLRAEFGKEVSVGRWKPWMGKSIHRLIVFDRAPLGKAFGPEVDEGRLAESLDSQGLSLSESEVLVNEDGMWAVIHVSGLANNPSEVVRHEKLFRQQAHTTPCRLKGT